MQRRAALVALALWSQACVTYRPAASSAPLPEWHRVRVSSAEPFALGLPTTVSTLVTACRVTGVEGIVRRMTADTLVLTEVSALTAARESRACPRGEDVTIALAPSMNLEVQQMHGGQTTGLVVGLALALAAVILYRVSNEPPEPVF